ncbi:MAG: metallophosphoesterase family protein [Clostridium sp.]
MIYVVSDTHFGHQRILEFDSESRPFKTVEEMDEQLISNWNEVVKDEDDIVYMLGDMFMGSTDNIDKIMPRLNGRKVLVRGNHDTNKRVELMEKYVEGVYSIYNLKVGKQIYVLCHYPMREWFGKDYGTIHIYGHVHSNEHRNGILAEPNSFHAGVDTNNLRPVALSDIRDKFVRCAHPNIKRKGNENGVYCVNCGKVVRKYVVNNVATWLV